MIVKSAPQEIPTTSAHTCTLRSFASVRDPVRPAATSREQPSSMVSAICT
jgi:hypothetical protein